MQIDLTIIIPCRNYEKYLKRSFRNLMNQFIIPNRIILVDDAGNSPEVCKKICDEYGVQYIRNNNHDGENTPRHPLQIGLDEVKKNPTEFVYVCGADSNWLPNKILCEYEEIKKSKKIGVVYSNMLKTTKDYRNQKLLIKKYSGNMVPDGLVHTVNKNDLIKSCIITDHALTRFDCYKTIDYKYRDDVHRNFMWDLWLNISEHYEIKFVDTISSIYWQHGDNISGKWDYGSIEFKKQRNKIINSAKKRRNK